MLRLANIFTSFKTNNKPFTLITGNSRPKSLRVLWICSHIHTLLWWRQVFVMFSLMMLIHGFIYIGSYSQVVWARSPSLLFCFTLWWVYLLWINFSHLYLLIELTLLFFIIFFIVILKNKLLLINTSPRCISSTHSDLEAITQWPKLHGIYKKGKRLVFKRKEQSWDLKN